MMNDYSRELMHMTTAEKAAYNRKYYQSHKDYWVEYYKLGQKRKGRNPDGLDVDNEADAFYNRKMIDDARLASKPIRTNQTSTYGTSSKSRYKVDPRLRYADEYQKHIRPRSIAGVVEEKKPVQAKQGHWNENAERVTSATRSFLSNLKNTIANAAKGATQTAARSAENGRKYASSMFSSVKATVGDIKREANELISRAKKTLDEVMSGEIQFQGKSGTRHNMATGKSFYYDTLKGIVQPISDSEALRFVNNGEEPRPWTLQDYQNEKKRRKAKKY